MRVAVDVTVLALPHTGIARYLGNMLEWVLPHGGDLEFFLYSARPLVLSLGGKWRLRHEDGIAGAVGGLWMQEVCPRWLKDDGIDVFWGQNYMMPVRLRRPCRRVLTLHDVAGVLVPHTMPILRRLNFALFQRQVAVSCDCLVVDSEATAHWARTCFGVDGKRIRVVLAGCDRVFTASPLGGAAERTLRHLDLRPGYLLAVGTIEPRKDLVTLLRAMSHLPGDTPQLVVAGAVGWRCGPILRELAVLQASGRVRYLGRVDDDELAELYRGARLLVYPSLYEGFGLPVLEAMSCGCPVVCSWSSSLPEVGGEAVRYFRPGDSEALSMVLARLLRTPAELDRMRTAGLRRAQTFSFRRAAGEILTILRGS